MPASTSTAARRVVAPTTPARGPRLPADWLRAIIAGLEAAALSWLTVVVPAVATYVATAAAPALGEASWLASARTGTALWLLGHGGSMALGEGAVLTVVPLGLTLLSVLLVYGSTRRMRLGSPGAGAFTVAGYVAAVGVLGLLATGAGARWGGLLGAMLVATVGVVPALRRGGAPPAGGGASVARRSGAPARRGSPPSPRWASRVRNRLPSWVSAGLHGAAWAGLGLTLCATALLAVALVLGWPQVVELHRSLAADPVSTVVLVLAQLAFLPALGLWALAWCAGPGFMVGTGTHFAADVVDSAPLPAVPVLGALPEPGTPETAWVVGVPVLVGVVVGVVLARRRAQEALPATVLSAVLSSVLVALGTAALVHAASGSIGPGRMSEVGAAAPVVAVAVLAEVGAGMLVAVVGLHPSTRGLVRRSAAAGAVQVRAVLGREAVGRSQVQGLDRVDAGPPAVQEASSRSGAGTVDRADDQRSRAGSARSD